MHRLGQAGTRASKLAFRCALILLIALVSNPPLVRGQAARPPVRTAKQIQDDLLTVDQQIKSSLNYPTEMVFEPALHEQMANEFKSVVNHRLTLERELAGVSAPFAAKMRFAILRDDAELTYFGDADAASRLALRAKSSDPADLTDAQVAQQLIAWWQANGKSDEQTRILDEMEKLAKSQPRNDDIACAIIFMIRTSPADVVIGRRANDLVCKTMKGPAAEAYITVPNKIDMPLAISGTTFKGPTFSMDKLKGKVVLIDFWTTTLQPCRDALPGLVKLYQDNHEKGLEILAVNSDSDRAVLAAYLKDHPEITWPQLFTANGSGAWHPLTKRYGIDSMPRIYLVDRAGILRYLDVFEKRQDELVQQLLAEPGPAGSNAGR